MAYLIENNAFTNDVYGIRATRLYFLSNSIDDYQAELSVEAGILSWAQNAADEFDLAQVKQTAELGEKNEAFQTSQESDILLAERYQILKELLQARYENDNDKLQIYGIMGPTPRSHHEVIDTAEAVIEGHNRLEAESDPNVLPTAMIDNLQTLIDDAKDTYYSTGIERLEAEQSTDEIISLYNNDSKKLRVIYNWAVAFWGKYDPRLIALGFVPATRRTGGGTTPGIPELGYSTSGFSWDEVEGATSYQLVYQALGDSEWIELYSGAMPVSPIAFEPGEGDWVAKLRARNTNGYGDWSEELSVFIGLRPAEIWELVYNSGTNQVTLQWHNPLGVNENDIYQSVVPIGDPAGSFTLIETISAQVYQHEVTNYDVTEYYYIVSRNAEYTSEPTETVSVDVPAA